jgi:hypothetical protein
MSEDKERKIIPTKGGGVFNDLAVRIKLIFRLIADPRVSPLLKLLPFGSLLYFILPDLAIGPIDDVAVVWLGTYLFVELCPPDVVQEHLEALKTQPFSGEWRNLNEPGGEVIDGEFWEKKDRE